MKRWWKHLQTKGVKFVRFSNDVHNFPYFLIQIKCKYRNLNRGQRCFELRRYQHQGFVLDSKLFVRLDDCRQHVHIYRIQIMFEELGIFSRSVYIIPILSTDFWTVRLLRNVRYEIVLPVLEDIISHIKFSIFFERKNFLDLRPLHPNKILGPSYPSRRNQRSFLEGRRFSLCRDKNP